MDVRALGLEFGGDGGGHLDPLGESPDLKLRIHAHHVVLVDQNVRGDKGAKSGMGDLDAVRAWYHRGNGVTAGIVGLDRARVIGLNQGDFDARAADAAAAGVGHIADNRAEGHLRGRRPAGQRQKTNQGQN